MDRSFTPPAHNIRWLDGPIPFSEQFEDVFYSREGGLEESRWVFLRGSEFPERWENRQQFVIGELGFGTGLNFLATWELWQRCQTPTARLHYVAFEKYPLRREDIRHALEPWSELSALREQLLEQVPLRLNGVHRAHFGNVTLTLVYGDARQTLNEMKVSVDAWFLDGFSPAQSSELWEESVFQSVAQLSRRDATVATYSAARKVLDGLSSVGFEMRKLPGFGSKRDMLCGRRNSLEREETARSVGALRIAVIGGGLAGTATARSLLRRNHEVFLFERESALAAHASGNTKAILMPHLSVKPDVHTRVALCSYSYVLNELSQLKNSGLLAEWNDCGVLRLASSNRLLALYESLSSLGIDLGIVDGLDEGTIARRFGLDVKVPGIFFPAGGELSPAELCRANLAGDTEKLKICLDVMVTRLESSEGKWVLYGSSSSLVEVDAVVFCGGHEVTSFAEASWLPLEKVRGQVLTLKTNDALSRLKTVLCYDGYLTPESNGVHLLGATFEHGNNSLEPGEVQSLDLLGRLREVNDRLAMNQHDIHSERVAFRAMSRDRLPIVGELPNLETFEAAYRAKGLRDFPTTDGRLTGLFVNTGFGSRGVLWSHLSAELLASQISSEPLPLESDLLEALDPARYPARLVRQGVLPTMENLATLRAPHYAKKNYVGSTG